MKQHITREQLNELNTLGRDRFKDWVVKKGYVKKPEFMVLPDHRPSIGQMIEFLGNEALAYTLFKVEDAYRADDACWVVPAWDGELCDALWEAVKKVLAKEE